MEVCCNIKIWKYVAVFMHLALKKLWSLSFLSKLSHIKEDLRLRNYPYNFKQLILSNPIQILQITIIIVISFIKNMEPMFLIYTFFFQDCLKGSLAKARVLYAPVEVVGGEDRLLRACSIHIFMCILIYFLFNWSNKIKQQWKLFVFLSWTFLEVITEAFTKGGLVLEKDAKQTLKVGEGHFFLT